jgi:hypothetical protein
VTRHPFGVREAGVRSRHHIDRNARGEEARHVDIYQSKLQDDGTVFPPVTPDPPPPPGAPEIVVPEIRVSSTAPESAASPTET